MIELTLGEGFADLEALSDAMLREFPEALHVGTGLVNFRTFDYALDNLSNKKKLKLQPVSMII